MTAEVERWACETRERRGGYVTDVTHGPKIEQLLTRVSTLCEAVAFWFDQADDATSLGQALIDRLQESARDPDENAADRALFTLLSAALHVCIVGESILYADELP